MPGSCGLSAHGNAPLPFYKIPARLATPGRPYKTPPSPVPKPPQAPAIIPPDAPIIATEQTTPLLMILAPASCLQTRTIRWVMRDLQGRQMGHQSLPASGNAAWSLAASYREAYAQEAQDRLPQW